MDLRDHTVAGGLAGVGLALLERTPIPAAEALMARVEALAEELTARLAKPDLRFPEFAFWRGGSGVALFLLHVYELTGDQSLLGPIQEALAQNLIVLDCPALAGPGAPAWLARPGRVATGPMSVAMVCHHATEHLHLPWLTQARDLIMARTLQQLLRWPGLGCGRAVALLAMQYTWSGPQARSQERLTLVQSHPDLMTLRAGPGRAGPNAWPCDRGDRDTYAQYWYGRQAAILEGQAWVESAGVFGRGRTLKS